MPDPMDRTDEDRAAHGAFEFFHELVTIAIQSWPDETPDRLAGRITLLLWESPDLLQRLLDQRQQRFSDLSVGGPA